MKTYLSIFIFLFIFLLSCNTSKNVINNDPKLESDTIRIANDEIEYEIIIIDIGFSSWFNANAKPRNYYSQSYLESRNRIWVLEWNRRYFSPSIYNTNLYESSVDYQQNIDYGYEVNYILYYYLTYFQIKNNQKLGTFSPRI